MIKILNLKPKINKVDNLYSFLDGVDNQVYYMSIDKNEVNLDDNWWNSILDPPKIKFNSIRMKGIEYKQERHSKKEFKCLIGLGEKTNQFGRRVLNVFEVTGLIGGIYEVLDIVIGTLIGFAYSFAFKVELK